MKKYFRRKYEIMLIKIARWVLYERNVSRSMVISRRDNNAMWGMAERLDSIIDRMENKYENLDKYPNY